MKKIYLCAFLTLGCINFIFALVNINSADYQTLKSVKGIGPKKAQAIIEYRNVHGKFHNINELSRVKGFNTNSVQKIAPQIEVYSN